MRRKAIFIIDPMAVSPGCNPSILQVKTKLNILLYNPGFLSFHLFICCSFIFQGAIRHSYGTNDKEFQISCIPFNAKTG
jgi:hypothetical protein